MSKGQDKLKCKHCGMVGLRYGVAEYVETKSEKFQECTRTKDVKIPDYVRVVSSELCRFGFVMGSEYPIVEAPKGERAGVWIFSPERKEPVRCLAGEYQPVDRKKSTEKVAIPEGGLLKKELDKLSDEGEAPQQFLF